MTNHPNRNKQGRTDIHYWMRKEGAYGAGARYIGTDRGKAKDASEPFPYGPRDSTCAVSLSSWTARAHAPARPSADMDRDTQPGYAPLGP